MKQQKKNDFSNYQLVLGKIINPQSDERCDYYDDGAMLLKKNQGGYKICSLGDRTTLLAGLNFTLPSELIIDRSNHFILPGLWDMHFHWVQNDVREMPKASLLDWLSLYTWPHEAKFSNSQYSLQKAREFFPLLAAAGTIGGAIYGSPHPHTVVHALQMAKGHFIAGNVLMTMNSPSSLLQDSLQAIEEVKELAEKYGRQYALTPRFALTTHPHVMKSCAREVAPHNCFIQTHLSETKEEIQTILELYRQIEGFKQNLRSYTQIYQECHILTPRTILGHCLHLDSSELKILAQSSSAIAHCPTSNAPISYGGLGSGHFDFLQVEKHGIPWALASDIGGGPHLSMIDVMNAFVCHNQDKPQANFTRALYRCTVAAAKILHKEGSAGNLSPQKEANFIVIDNCRPKKNKDDSSGKTHSPSEVENILAKIISQNNEKRDQYQNLVRETYWQGRKIY